jgi:hypothetical protein
VFGIWCELIDGAGLRAGWIHQAGTVLWYATHEAEAEAVRLTRKMASNPYTTARYRYSVKQRPGAAGV